MSEPVRLSKVMAARGLCSRREADRFIAEGRVQVDGEVVTVLGTRIDPGQEIRLDGHADRAPPPGTTVLLHKPAGYVSGQPEKNYPAAVTLVDGRHRHRPGDPVPDRHGLAPAGRLDIDSTGLLVFTRDGRIARQLVGPNSRIEKEYRVRVEGEITPARLDTLCHGLALDGRPLRPARVERLAAGRLRFVLTEGRKRQVRRMCELVGLGVTHLVRVRIGDVRLGNLPPGRWRLLDAAETF